MPKEHSFEEYKKAQQRTLIRRISIIVLIAFALVGVLYGLSHYSQIAVAELPGEGFTSLGQEHIALNADLPTPYNSNPPTSGAHYAEPANWGIYDYEVNDKIFIHNLEHGGIWIAYKPGVSKGIVDDLIDIADSLGRVKIVMAPRAANDADVAIAAWTRVQKFTVAGDRLSDDQKKAIHAFYNDLVNRGPEAVPASMPGIDPKNAK